MIESKEIIIRLLLAAFFGAIIGLERERKNWAAGLKNAYDGVPWCSFVHDSICLWLW